LDLLGQSKIDLFFNEFYVSINKSNVHDDNTDDRYGFGLGVDRSFRRDKKMNFIFGWEYNRVSQFKKYEYTGHFSHNTDITYNTNYLSFPLGLRLNFGIRPKIILEAGGFADLSAGGKCFGTSHSYMPDENDKVIYRDSQFESRCRLPSSVGLYYGIGTIIPISTVALIVKGEYKTGLNAKTGFTYEEFSNKYLRLLIGLKIN
jgi:hypothetical protein